MYFRTYTVPDRMNDGEVALECSDEDAVGRCNQKRPKQDSGKPDATDELIIGAFT